MKTPTYMDYSSTTPVDHRVAQKQAHTDWADILFKDKIRTRKGNG
jgi:hypothetical protein